MENRAEIVSNDNYCHAEIIKDDHELKFIVGTEFEEGDGPCVLMVDGLEKNVFNMQDIKDRVGGLDDTAFPQEVLIAFMSMVLLDYDKIFN